MALPHSYMRIHPAGAGTTARLDRTAHAPGIHHLALWARGRR